MQNPTLNRRKFSGENALLPIDEAKRLFQVIYAASHKEEKEDDSPKIKVSSLVSKMAFFYEKIRNSVDYKEEHLLRKNAIERILKRLIVIEGALRPMKSEDAAYNLLTELIRADYLPNNKLPEAKAVEVALLIDRYVLFRRIALQTARVDFQGKQDLTNWVITMAACHIEESLGRSETIEYAVDYMYRVLTSAVELPDGSPYEKDKDIQIFLSIHRNFLKFDSDMLEFILLKFYNSGWKEADTEMVEKAARNYAVLRSAISEQVEHPLARQLDRVAGRYTVFFRILIDVIEEDAGGFYNYLKHDPKAFPRSIKRVCEKHYKETKKKLWRAGIRSIIYIFLTKMVLAVILEVPVARLIGETTSALSLALNIGFPPFLLFMIIFFTRVPSSANTDKIVEGINKIMFAPPSKGAKIKLRTPVKRSGNLQGIFTLVYAVTFFVSFGFIVYILRQIHFSPISIILFLFFLTLVSFFSIRIRKTTREMIVVEPRESIVTLLSDFFYTPILAVGKFLSEKFSRINVFIFILDFIIEAPFKIFIEIADEWSKYVRERRDEIG
jgi:hypothetical protein